MEEKLDFFYKLNLKNLLREWEDELSSVLFEMGAMGVSEDLVFKQEGDNYIPETVVTSHFELVAYFAQAPEMESTDFLVEKFPGLQWEILREANKDWLEEWKKGYVATELSDGVWVVPSWLEAPGNSQLNIFVDPGMAFGTGTHATTKIACEMICSIYKNKKIDSVLDVGTGTGILAILANKLGATEVYATEIDLDARKVAKENTVLNKATSIQVFDEQVESLTQPVQLVIANIIDGVLVQIKEDLKRLCLPGGYLLLTGILEEREEGFRTRFGVTSDGFEVVDRDQQDEWVGLLLRRKKV